MCCCVCCRRLRSIFNGLSVSKVCDPFSLVNFLDEQEAKALSEKLVERVVLTKSRVLWEK